MYNGPYYYLKPGHYRHQATARLLSQRHCDGAILTQQVFTPHFHLLPQTVEALLKLRSPVLIDDAQYDPSASEILKPADATAQLHNDGAVRAAYVNRSLDRQLSLGATGFIAPNLQVAAVSNDWAGATRAIAETSRLWADRNAIDQRPLFLTVAVSRNDIVTAERRMLIIDSLCDLQGLVSGIYLSVHAISPNTSDRDALAGLLEVIFRLKWNGLEVLLTDVGPWVPLAFVAGLDFFANDGMLTTQETRNVREVAESGGGRGRNYWRVWSPAALCWLRYPDDALPLYKSLTPNEYQTVFASGGKFPPNLKANPDLVYATEDYGDGLQRDHFCSHMGALALKYRGLTDLKSRISATVKLFTDSLRHEERISRITSRANRGEGKQVCLDVFHKFLADFRSDLERIYK